MGSQIDALKKQNAELETSLAGLKSVPTVVSRPIEPLLIQLEEMRSSQAAERQLREKEIRKLNSELKSAKRENDVLKQQLSELETDHASCLNRIRQQADELSTAQREVPLQQFRTF